ncbi:GNAT family N-acetyltransferase [Streptomyces sp. NPDC005526]|uniref:GNAT family N-acetyltransferase n=1 Tax=Streptomyces sp. NPDC005526 TaxID=3156885 RepID=UPI0033B3D55D
MIDAPRGGEPLVIRTARPTEAEDVAALMVRARSTYYPDGMPDADADWPARWREAIERPGSRVLCAVRDGRLIGVASFRTPEGAPAETVKLFQFHVDPGHWRTGVGTALHTACMERWRADGRRTAVLEVHAGNRRAQAFYAARGWTADQDVPADPGDHHLVLRRTVAVE